MLNIRSITLEDFGPFKGTQSITLPEDPGVTVVFGENMRGKTMLLNSIRYALYGRVLSRGSKEISPEQVINWESKEEGKHSFKVILDFEHEDDDYELTRMFKPRDGVTEPVDDDDYIEEVYLRKNGDVLGPDEKDRELNRIMPEKVSRFFLFDGELLQQYEELLVDESKMGQRIREAIERILGLPVLTNARADLRELLEDAEKAESKAAQRNQKTQELGAQLESLTETRSHLNDELEELKEDLSDLQDREASLHEDRKKIEAIRDRVEEKKDLEEEVDQLNDDIDGHQQRLRDEMADAWRGIIRNPIQKKLEALRKRESDLRSTQTRIAVRKELANRFEKAVEGSHCPVCEQDLGEETESHIKKELEDLRQVEEQDTEAEEEYRDVARAISILEDLEAPDPAERIEGIVQTIDRLKAERTDKKDTIADIENEIESSQEDEVHAINREYKDVIKKIQATEDAIEETEEEIKEANQNIKKLQAQLDKESGADFEKERERRKIFKHLRDLFDDGVDVYRDKLRDEVEEDASRIFLDLTTEPEYDGLRINENYGLTIVHEDGDDIPVRSAGAEHVVALSLMGALQNNAPLQGPIIMDSPFGRLDEQHEKNVVQALPAMTDQVLLLVYRSELRPEAARDFLKGKLRAEYSMERISARHTDLVKGGGDD